MNVLLFLSLLCFIVAGVWAVMNRSWPLLTVAAGGVLLVLALHPAFPK